MPRLVTFEVLGQKYSLYTEASDADVQEILNLVKSQIEAHVGTAVNVLPSSKAAVLASLNVASEYVKLKKDCARQLENVGSHLDMLTEKIENLIRE